MTQIKIVHSTVPLNYLASCYSIPTVWFPLWPIPSHLFNCNKIRKEVKVSTANRLTGRNNHLFLTFTLFYQYCSTLEWTSAASILHLPSLERGWMFKMFPFFKSSMFPQTTRFVWSQYQITQRPENNLDSQGWRVLTWVEPTNLNIYANFDMIFEP